MKVSELRKKLVGVPDDYEVEFHFDGVFDVEVEHDDEPMETIEDVELETTIDFDDVCVHSASEKVVINLTY